MHNDKASAPPEQYPEHDVQAARLMSQNSSTSGLLQSSVVLHRMFP